MFYHKRRHVFYPSAVAFLKEFSYLAKTDKKRRIVMDRNLTLYQLSPERAAKIFDRIDMFNRGRTETNGKYVISMPTPYRPYYGFWRIFLNDNAPLFIRTLAVTFDAAAERAFALLQNCNVLLDVQDNAVFESCYGQSDDIIPFGKYRGKRLAEIFYVDPSYVLWLANKFVVETKRYEPLVLLAKKFAKVHFELTIQKKHISSVSRYIGEVGDKLKDMFLTVLNVRLQVDTYKADFYVDQNVLAADRDGNRFTFFVKAAARSQTPNALSCHSRKINTHEVLHFSSAKIMAHYESKGVHYTRLGYVKLV